MPYIVVLRQRFGMTIFDDRENHLAGNIKKKWIVHVTEMSSMFIFWQSLKQV